MITLTTEQAQQIEVTIALSLGYFPETVDGGVAMERAKKSIAAIRAARAQEQNPVAWYDKIKGMEVSVDVSTGEDDIHHRIFGRVDSVMLQSCGAQEDTILVIEDSRNFAAPQPVNEAIGEVDIHMDFLRINWKGGKHPPRGTKLYSAPVRTKDLTQEEIDRLCAAIKAEDDYCVDNGDYMLDSNDCIKIIRGEWVRPDYNLDNAVIAADREKNK